MKNLWIVGNWKSNKTVDEALSWVKAVGPQLTPQPTMKVVVCTDFIALEEVKKCVTENNYPLLVGTQDLSPFNHGPYTGEEAAELLQGVADVAILGHSERRKNFAETDELIAQKVARAVENNIMPLLCVQDENTPIPDQCRVVAYEPIFAIGSGTPDTPENADAVAGKIKQKEFDLEILYGGSVKASNVRSFVDQPNISGVLIGGASLDPQEFIDIIKACL